MIYDSKSYKIDQKTYQIIYTVFTQKNFLRKIQHKGVMSGISFADNTTDFIEFFRGDGDLPMPWNNEIIDIDNDNTLIFYKHVEGSQNRSIIAPGNQTAIYDAAGLCIKVLRKIFGAEKTDIEVAIKETIDGAEMNATKYKIYITDVDDNVGKDFNESAKNLKEMFTFQLGDGNEPERRGYRDKLKSQNDSGEILQYYGGHKKSVRRKGRMPKRAPKKGKKSAKRNNNGYKEQGNKSSIQL